MPNKNVGGETPKKPSGAPPLDKDQFTPAPKKKFSQRLADLAAKKAAEAAVQPVPDTPERATRNNGGVEPNTGPEGPETRVIPGTPAPKQGSVDVPVTVDKAARSKYKRDGRNPGAGDRRPSKVSSKAPPKIPANLASKYTSSDIRSNPHGSNDLGPHHTSEEKSPGGSPKADMPTSGPGPSAPERERRSRSRYKNAHEKSVLERAADIQENIDRDVRINILEQKICI